MARTLQRSASTPRRHGLDALEVRRNNVLPNRPGQPRPTTPTCNSQLCALWEELHSLAHSEICHDFLTASQNACELERALEHFNILAHAAGCKRTATEKLTCLVSDKSHRASRLVLQHCDGASHLHHLHPLVHVGHLVGHRLMVTLQSLDGTDDPTKFVTDHRLSDQLLAEDFTLHAPQETVLQDRPDPSHHPSTNQPTFMVEVGHDKLEALILFPHEILNGDIAIIEEDP